MKRKDRPRFDIGELRDLAGEKAFARGEAYYRDGQVRILAIEPDRVLAQVAGTEDYRTTLTGRGKRIDGECSCPAFEDWGFCKHMVATALAVNAAGENGDTDGAGALARIRGHLKGKGVDALVEMIVGIAERDLALFRRLDLAAATVHGDDGKIEARLRQAIDAATRTSDYVDYREAAGWVDGVDAALDALAGLASGAHAGIVLKLAARAIDRIGQAMEAIDDSDGGCGALLHRARDIHLAAARAARPDPARLAQDLFAREMGDEYGTFDGAAELYSDILGDKGLAAYRRLAAEAWEKLPPRAAGRSRRDFSTDYEQLKNILDAFAERAGDVETRVAIRAKDLSSPWNYLQLVEFCRAQGRQAEALRRAEEGLWIFEDDVPDERLVSVAVDLLAKAGREEDAVAHLWRAFEKAPSLELYARLRKSGGKAARVRALAFLEGRMAAKQGTRWSHGADLLVHILMREKLFDAAWSTARAHGASMGVKEALAEASAATHPAEALEVHARRVEELVDAGGDPAYAAAAKLVARMTALRGAAEQAAYVAALKERHRRKRNFMKLLG